MAPQSIPFGLLLTLPDPAPVFCIVRNDMLTAGLNVAVTDRFVSITTEQEPVPLQSPLHPAKVEPTAGAGVKATVGTPVQSRRYRFPDRISPLGLLVTEPTPIPSIVTVSVTGGEGLSP